MAIYEMSEEMDMPCVCDICGELFELNEGNPCSQCRKVYCSNCLDEPWEICEYCQ